MELVQRHKKHAEGASETWKNIRWLRRVLAGFAAGVVFWNVSPFVAFCCRYPTSLHTITTISNYNMFSPFLFPTLIIIPHCHPPKIISPTSTNIPTPIPIPTPTAAAAVFTAPPVDVRDPPATDSVSKLAVCHVVEGSVLSE